LERWTFIGVNPPNKDNRELDKGEFAAFQQWVSDPYAGGVNSKLNIKREARNPWRRKPAYQGTIGLLNWTGGMGGQSIFPDELPWSEGLKDKGIGSFVFGLW
jgi:hypothetical protein